MNESRTVPWFDMKHMAPKKKINKKQKLQINDGRYLQLVNFFLPFRRPKHRDIQVRTKEKRPVEHKICIHHLAIFDWLFDTAARLYKLTTVLTGQLLCFYQLASVNCFFSDTPGAFNESMALILKASWRNERQTVVILDRNRLQAKPVAS